MAKYNVRRVIAENAAIGDRASIRVHARQDPAQEEAQRELRRLISLLPAQAHMLGNPVEVRADAEAAQAALREKKLNRVRIEEIVRRLAVGVAGVASLTNAVEAIQTALTRLFT